MGEELDAKVIDGTLKKVAKLNETFVVIWLICGAIFGDISILVSNKIRVFL